MFVTESMVPQVEADVFRNLTCMTLAYSTSNEIIVGGNSSLFRMDLNKPSQILAFKHRGDLSFINYSSKLLTLGNSLGSLEIFDPTANQTVKSFSGHNGLLSDLDVKGNYVATCGYSARTKRYGGQANSVEYMVDPLVNVYDLRTMRALSPIPFSAGASFVKFHPKLPNIIIIASTTGQIQFVDMYDLLEVHLYQADLTDPSTSMNSASAPTSSYLSSLDVSENGEYLCFSDGFKNMHLWSMNTSTSTNFANFPSALDRPDVTAEIVTNPIGLDDKVPLNAIGMPYYKEYLASNFPTDMIFTKELAKLPHKIDIDVPPGFHAYDKNKYGPRYVLKAYEPLKVNTHLKSNKRITKTSLIPKFISERSMTSSPVPSLLGSRGADTSSPGLMSTPTFNDFNDNDNDAINLSFDDSIRNEDTIFQFKSAVENRVPSCYTKLDIHYSKFGVDDFDFDYYNQSNGLLAGLENHLDNSYVNLLLQLYRYIPVFYNTVTESLLQEYLPNDKETICAKANLQGSSILNELAYLYDMMRNAGSRNVRTSNFSSILSESNIAKVHGLINKDDGKSLSAPELQQLIMMFNKFLIESIVSDFKIQFDRNVQDLTALHFELDFMSTSGELLDKQYSTQATLDLVTPPSSVLARSTIMGNNRFGLGAKKNNTLLTYLDYTLNQVRAFPPSSSNPYHMDVKLSLYRLGPVLLINMPFSDQEFALIKSFKKWLVPEFYKTTGNTGKIIMKPVITQFSQKAERYELQGYVCQISHGGALTSGRHNLVSYVKVKSPALGEDQWFLFNDFLVMPIPEEEVLNISYSWKKPVILVYHNVEDARNQRFQYFEKELFRRYEINDSILFRDHFACGIREGFQKEYELLTEEEAPRCGSLVAIDAEFVSLRPEITEVSYTGVKNLVRPTLLSLARVSALRGDQGLKHGLPFIDDYIVHTKPIYDYLTTFSGIETGDLDPSVSRKTLVTLQTAYRRLWLLLNIGCVFVGHGLKSDFRCINLQVPKAQIRDTIEFYYLPAFRRMLSLKFLAYSVLKESVQTKNHDSIEDARTALRLYEKYMELKATGEFELALHRIYNEGQQLRFRVPE